MLQKGVRWSQLNHSIEEGCVILINGPMSLWPFKKHVLLKASSRRGEKALEVGRGALNSVQCRRVGGFLQIGGTK